MYIYGKCRVEHPVWAADHLWAIKSTGGSCISHIVVKPDSHLARIFVAKFLCIIKLIIIIG